MPTTTAKKPVAKKAAKKPATKRAIKKAQVEEVKELFTFDKTTATKTKNKLKKRVLNKKWGATLHGAIALQDGEIAGAELKNYVIATDKGETKVALAKGVIPSSFSHFPKNMSKADKDQAAILIEGLKNLEGFGVLVYRYESAKGVSFYATIQIL